MVAVRGPWRPPYVLGAVTFAYLAWALLPIVAVIAFSFNDGVSVSSWEGFSSRWWIGRHSVFSNPGLMRALGQSLLLAVPATLVAVPVGAAFAIGLDRWRGRPARVTNAAMLFAFVTPELLLGAAMYLALTVISRDFRERNFSWFGTKAQLVGLITLQIPIAAIVVRAGLLTIDRHLEEIAMDLGAPPLQALRRAVYPQLRPTLLACVVFVFARSLENFVVVNALRGPESSVTMSMVIYGSRFDASPALNAAGTMVTVLAVAAMVVGLSAYRAAQAARRLATR